MDGQGQPDWPRTFTLLATPDRYPRLSQFNNLRRIGDNPCEPAYRSPIQLHLRSHQHRRSQPLVTMVTFAAAVQLAWDKRFMSTDSRMPIQLRNPAER